MLWETPESRFGSFAGRFPGPRSFRGLLRNERTPGVRFSKDPKTSRKPPSKAPETTFGCFSKHPKTFDPGKYVIFPRKLHGYSLPPEKRFRVCFSCTCLIKWRPPTYFLGQNKWPRSCIKRERVEEGRENNVVRKYGIYQNEFQWLIAVNRQISKHYRVRRESQRNFHTCQAVWGEFDFFCRKFLTKPPKFVQQLGKTKSYRVLNDWGKEHLLRKRTFTNHSSTKFSRPQNSENTPFSACFANITC